MARHHLGWFSHRRHLVLPQSSDGLRGASCYPFALPFLTWSLWLILVNLLLKSNFEFSSWLILVSLGKDFRCLTCTCKVFKLEQALFKMVSIN